MVHSPRLRPALAREGGAVRCRAAWGHPLCSLRAGTAMCCLGHRRGSAGAAWPVGVSQGSRAPQRMARVFPLPLVEFHKPRSSPRFVMVRASGVASSFGRAFVCDLSCSRIFRAMHRAYMAGASQCMSLADPGCGCSRICDSHGQRSNSLGASGPSHCHSSLSLIYTPHLRVW